MNAALDTFFEPLVGTPTQVGNLRATLTGHVTSGRSRNYDPFVQLTNGVLLEIDRAIADRDAPDQMGAEGGKYSSNVSVNWHAINHNAQTGVGFGLAALKTVSKLYQSKAQVPQQYEQVKAQTLTALRHTQSIAFSTVSRGAVNVYALRLGMRPTVLALAAGLLSSGVKKPFESPKVSPRSYITSIDSDGQLVLLPRHKMYRTPLANRGCPAAFNKVEHGGRQKNSLTLFMQTIGEVAIDQVFPQQFEITK